MFYLILITKLLILLFLPIYLNRIVQNDGSFSKSYINTIFLLFIIYSALLTYIPFTIYYFENEVNIQTFLPFYGLIGFIIFYSVLPISFFIIQIKKIYIQSFFDRVFKIFGLISLIITILLIAEFLSDLDLIIYFSGIISFKIRAISFFEKSFCVFNAKYEYEL